MAHKKKTTEHPVNMDMLSPRDEKRAMDRYKGKMSASEKYHHGMRYDRLSDMKGDPAHFYSETKKKKK